jgi:hypothetical protein
MPQNLIEQRDELEAYLQKHKKLKMEAAEKKAPSPAQI